MNPNPSGRPLDGVRKLLRDLKLQGAAVEFLSSEKGAAWKTSLVDQLKAEWNRDRDTPDTEAAGEGGRPEHPAPQPAQTQRHDRQDRLMAFQEDLRDCRDVWDVVRLLLKYGAALGVVNVRYH